MPILAMCAKQCLKAYRMEEIYDEHKFDRYATPLSHSHLAHP